MTWAVLEQRLLVERPADQLQPQRQALGVEAGRHGDARQAGHVHRHRENVVQVHLDRIGGHVLVGDAEGGGRRRRRQDRVDAGGEDLSKSRLISVRTFCACR